MLSIGYKEEYIKCSELICNKKNKKGPYNGPTISKYIKSASTTSQTSLRLLPSDPDLVHRLQLVKDGYNSSTKASLFQL